MARTIALLGLSSLLTGLTTAQRPGPSPEVHPKITTFRCSKEGGCVEKTNYIVLDSLAHPVSQANGRGCGNWGEAPPVDACPDKETCRDNCIMDGIPDYSRHGVTTTNTSLRLQHILPNGNVVSPRVYLLDETEDAYEMLSLTGYEFTFEVDATKLPCGMNSALYLSEMDKFGAKSEINPGGAHYGTGYCDAQCFVTPFINGEANIDGNGACCNEFDIWEANSRAAHIAPHPCNVTGPYLCTGAECERDGVCDKPGCAWNPWRVGITDYYGNNDTFKVDTRRPFTVITQFPADASGKALGIRRHYVQDGKLIETYTVERQGLPRTDIMNDEFCAATNSEPFLRLGGTQAMGDALTRGMVLAMSIWWDEGGFMQWLDSGEAGPCNATEGDPRVIRQVEPYPEVTYSNLRWGEIGSTYKASCKVKL